jgi:hypothetical protein
MFNQHGSQTVLDLRWAVVEGIDNRYFKQNPVFNRQMLD